MKKLRLLLTENCNRECKGCCNTDWDIKNLPEISADEIINENFDLIMITGGEPLLYPHKLYQLLFKLGFEGRSE